MGQMYMEWVYGIETEDEEIDIDRTVVAGFLQSSDWYPSLQKRGDDFLYRVPDPRHTRDFSTYFVARLDVA